MGILTGWFCLLLFCLLAGKAVTHKLRLVKADCLFMKLHKPLCVLLIAALIVHFLLVQPVFHTRNVLVYVTGILTAVLFIPLIVYCHTIKKDPSLRLRWHRIFSAAMLLCIATHMVLYYMDFQNYQKKIDAISFQGAIADLPADGVYTGEYDAGYIFARVQVTVTNGSIQDILLLEHRNEKGRAAEKVIDEILDGHKFPVDAVSGATNSGRVIQKAIQNALEE